MIPSPLPRPDEFSLSRKTEKSPDQREKILQRKEKSIKKSVFFQENTFFLLIFFFKAIFYHKISVFPIMSDNKVSYNVEHPETIVIQQQKSLDIKNLQQTKQLRLPE